MSRVGRPPAGSRSPGTPRPPPAADQHDTSASSRLVEGCCLLLKDAAYTQIEHCGALAKARRAGLMLLTLIGEPGPSR